MAPGSDHLLHRHRQHPQGFRIRRPNFHISADGEWRKHSHRDEPLQIPAVCVQLRRDHPPHCQCIQRTAQSHNNLGLPRSDDSGASHVCVVRHLRSGLRPVSTRERMDLGEIHSGSPISHGSSNQHDTAKRIAPPPENIGKGV